MKSKKEDNEVCKGCKFYKSFSVSKFEGYCRNEESDHYGHLIMGEIHRKCITGKVHPEK